MKTAIQIVLVLSLCLTACGAFVDEGELAGLVRQSLQESMAKDEAYTGVELKDVTLARESGGRFKGWVEYAYGNKLEKVPLEVTTDGGEFAYSVGPPVEIFLMKTFGLTEVPANQ